MDCSLPGFSLRGILQARILNWVPIFFSRGSSQPRNRTQVCWLRADSLPTELQGKPYCSYSIGLAFTTRHIPTGHHFYFGSASSFFLELFLCSSPVAYSTRTDPGGSSFSFLSYCSFILFMGFSRQECWSRLPFPSPVNHVLSELSTMNCHLGGPARYGS